MHNLNSVLKETQLRVGFSRGRGRFRRRQAVRSKDLRPHARSMISEMTTWWIDYHKRLMGRATDSLVKDAAMYCYIHYSLDRRVCFVCWREAELRRTGRSTLAKFLNSDGKRSTCQYCANLAPASIICFYTLKEFDKIATLFLERWQSEHFLQEID